MPVYYCSPPETFISGKLADGTSKSNSWTETYDVPNVKVVCSGVSPWETRDTSISDPVQSGCLLSSFQWWYYTKVGALSSVGGPGNSRVCGAG